MFARIVIAALMAGASVGLIVGLLQWYFMQPLLLLAELYESGTAMSTAQHLLAPPHLDWLRDGLSLVFAIIIYVGYALVLAAVMTLSSQRSTARITTSQGILWGLVGYGIAQMAPAFGLAPELPGSIVAEIKARQLWWWGTILATTIAFGLMVYGRYLLRSLAILLLLTPHLIGAPHPEVLGGSAPPELAALFASRTLGIGLVAWLLLGLTLPYWLAQAAKLESQED